MFPYAQRRRILLDWLIIILFLFFVIFPEINRRLLIIPDIPSTEKRILASYPVFDTRNIDDFIKKFDLFYKDHFGLRLRLVAANTFLHLHLFGTSGVRHVVIGKRGWLFINEYAPTDSKGFSGWQGYNPYSLDQLAAIQNSLEAEHMWFTKRNITFLIVPAPDKNSIYPEHLPWRFSTIVGQSRQAQIFQHMKLYSKLELIDVRQVLINAKKLHQLNTYYKTDSHWNTHGAFFAYEEIMKRLLVIYPEFIPYRLEDFIQDRKLKYRGDLARMANLDVSDILEDQLIPKHNETTNSAGPRKGKILFFGDSFTDFHLKDYFRRHFVDVKYIHCDRNAITKLKKYQVLNYHPDVVIFQSVERFWTRI